MHCASHWELAHHACRTGSHCTAHLLLGVSASQVSCWESLHPRHPAGSWFVTGGPCRAGSWCITCVLMRVGAAHMLWWESTCHTLAVPCWDSVCFAHILLVAGTLHTGSALLGVVVLPVSCWELVCQVCPTESLGTARILLGISQSFVSCWELVHLMGLSPTGSQCITSVLLGVRSSHASCWQSGHQLGAGASRVSPVWLGFSVSRVLLGANGSHVSL